LACDIGCTITWVSTACTILALFSVTLGFGVINFGGKLVGILNKLASVLASSTEEF